MFKFGCLPLPLIYLSNRYSVSLSIHQREVEAVVEECWREEWKKQSNIQQQDQSTARFSTFQPSKQVRKIDR